MEILLFTEHDGQVTGYMDRNPVLSSFDLVRAEEAVHYPALQHPSPRSFLLLGADSRDMLRRLSKYSPERFDYCEADPAIFKMGSKYLPSTEKSDSLLFQWMEEAGC